MRPRCAEKLRRGWRCHVIVYNIRDIIIYENKKTKRTRNKKEEKRPRMRREKKEKGRGVKEK